MNTNFYITIGRQLGSGGHSIGKSTAQQLGIAFYDKELIYLASEKSGLGKEFFENLDEKSTFSLTSGLFGLRNSLIDQIYPNDFLSNETLFNLQSDTIRELADKGPAVFVGRCADYVLKKKGNCFNVFIYADLEDRVKQISESNGITLEEAKDLIHKTDKHRAAYYNYFSDKKWSEINSYHLCINTSFVAPERAVELICKEIVHKFNLKD